MKGKKKEPKPHKNHTKPKHSVGKSSQRITTNGSLITLFFLQDFTKQTSNKQKLNNRKQSKKKTRLNRAKQTNRNRQHETKQKTRRN